MELFTIALENLRNRKKRAYLTIIGVFIGIMAVVALVSLGQGLQAGVNEQFSKLGIDKVFVAPTTVPGGASITEIGNRDLNRIKNVAGVIEVAGYRAKTAKIDWSQTTVYQTVSEIPEGNVERALIVESLTIEIEEGRLLESGDKLRVVIGSGYTDDTVYTDPLSVGRTIIINNASATIVGILKKIGDPGLDNGVFVPTVLYKQVFPAESAADSYSTVIVRVAKGEQASQVSENIKESLRRFRGQKPGEEDFTVQTTEDIKESFDKILGIIQTVLFGIAMISLLVGAIGIMNTMYTAVLERTKEIGIMKAIGASNEAILSIFLIESALLGFVGGAVGCILGLGISFIASIIATQVLGTTIIQFVLSWWLIVGALAFGTIIGAIAGFFPARAAAQQKPVDSLRYE